MCPVTYELLDPREIGPLPKALFREDLVRLAQAIVMAYGCIEELGLNVPAGPGRRSWLNGTWNPPVKADLEAKLRESHINLNVCSMWNLRGPRTKIELTRPPLIIRRAPWAGRGVRDGEMELIDAIAYVDWLRDRVAAHKADDKKVRVLSVDIVANAQEVARRLLLETLGFGARDDE